MGIREVKSNSLSHEISIEMCVNYSKVSKRKKQSILVVDIKAHYTIIYNKIILNNKPNNATIVNAFAPHKILQRTRKSAQLHREFARHQTRLLVLSITMALVMERNLNRFTRSLIAALGPESFEFHTAISY